MLATLSPRTACLSWHVSTQLLSCRGGLHSFEISVIPVLVTGSLSIIAKVVTFHSACCFWVDSPIMFFLGKVPVDIYADDTLCENILISCWLSACSCCAALSSKMLRISVL